MLYISSIFYLIFWQISIVFKKKYQKIPWKIKGFLNININNSNLWLSHYKIIVKTHTTSTATTFLTANYPIILPPSCSNKLDAASIYEIDLELVKVGGSYNLLGVISKFS